MLPYIHFRGLDFTARDFPLLPYCLSLDGRTGGMNSPVFMYLLLLSELLGHPDRFSHVGLLPLDSLGALLD